MRLYHSIGDLPLGGPRRVVAIGAFDGVHLGHQAIIGRAVGIARERGLPAMVVTFEPNPMSVLRPELSPTMLTSPGLKAALIEHLGVDELLVVPFNRSFARIRHERFAEMLGSAPIGADVVVVGESFRFGHQGAGTVEWLRSYGRGSGLRVEVPAAVVGDDGKQVSSTRIRRLVAQGRVEEVIALLGGRAHCVEGRVVPGDQRGRALGLPTANLHALTNCAVPARGVYAGRVVAADGRRAAAVNVGYAPTFTEGHERPPLRVEAFLLDYEGPDLYGQSIRVEFLARLRDERRFDSAEELVAQVRADVRRTRELVSG